MGVGFDGANIRSKIVGALGESVQTVATLRSGHIKERMVYILAYGGVHRALIHVIRVSANERPYINDEAGFCCVRRGAGHGTLDA